MTSRRSRREVLRLLAAGTLGPAGLTGWMAEALAAAEGGQGVVQLEGTASVNGNAAKVGTPVQAGDRVATGKDAQCVVVVGKDAFLLRGGTSLVVKGQGPRLDGLALLGGKLLSVFARKPMAVEAGVAAIGIRGTGAYLEVEPKRVYFCLCYGEAVIDGPNMRSHVVQTKHHESPLYLLEDGSALRAEPGPFLNHKDSELVMLEALVGREPPFIKDGAYPGGRY